MCLERLALVRLPSPNGEGEVGTHDKRKLAFSDDTFIMLNRITERTRE
jgi:hypothetical protein